MSEIGQDDEGNTLTEQVALSKFGCVFNTAYYITETQERLSVLEKSRLSDGNKSSWNLVIIPELMSSELSCFDTDDDILIKRQLPW